MEETLGDMQQLTDEITEGAIDGLVAQELDTAATMLDDLVNEASSDPSLILDPGSLTVAVYNMTVALEVALVVVEEEIDDAQHDVNVLITVVVVISVLFVALLIGLVLAFTKPWSKTCTLPGQGLNKKKRSPDLIDDSAPELMTSVAVKSYVSHSESDFVASYNNSTSNTINNSFSGSHGKLSHKEDEEEVNSKKIQKVSKKDSSIAMTSIRYTGDFMDDEVNYGKTGAVVDLNPWQNTKISNGDHGGNLARNGSSRSSSGHKSQENSRADSKGSESKVNDVQPSVPNSDFETNGNIFIADSGNEFIRDTQNRSSGPKTRAALDLQLHIIENGDKDC